MFTLEARFLLDLDELLRPGEWISPAKNPTDQLLFRRKLSAARAAFADIWDVKLERVQQQAALYQAKIKESDTQVETLPGRLLDAETKTVVQAYEGRLPDWRKKSFSYPKELRDQAVRYGASHRCSSSPARFL
ncbi:MAG: hypothetical protein ACFB11_10240 [Paracoccaceae bacterium]